MSIPETNCRTSYDGNNIADLTEVIAEFPEGDDQPNHLPIKKLQGAFDTISASERASTAAAKHDNNMKVFVRIRPIASKLESTVHVTSNNSITTTAPTVSKRAKNTQIESRNYTFHRAFGPDLSQSAVFDQAIVPLVNDRFLKGESCVLFAYGISNAGKTHTILGTPIDPGIIPRLVTTVHDTLPVGQKDELKVSMFEIYQEKIYDLLNKRSKLNIRDQNGRAEVANLSVHSVTSPIEAQKLLNKGSSKRVSSRTLLNSGSSRSHAIYQLTLRGQVFMIIDLAGAERNNRTLASGNQQKEANNINMSLMQLWRCLYAVKKKNDSTDMVPFRESKLTHILMPTLYRVGTTGAAMIACVNPQSADYDETISVLGNASLACEINVKEIVPVKDAPKPSLRRQASRASVASTATNSTRGSVSSSTSGSVVSKSSAVEAAAAASGKESRKRKVATSEVTESSSKSVRGNNDELVAALNTEIESLKAANKAMQSAQLEREQEIRVEVCNEMAEYSQGLLDQIELLQEEIMELKSCGSDHRKSVKKVKREQRSLEHEEAIKNLADSEEEMERQKRYYDAEIKSLKQEIRNSKIEIADWKLQAESVAYYDEENSASKKHKRKPLGTISPNVSPTQDLEDQFVKPKKDKRSTSPYRETDGSKHPGIAPPVSPKMIGSGPFFTRSLRSTTVRI